MSPTQIPDAVIADEAARLGFQAVILFGSRATGLARPESDWDLAVLVPDDRGSEERERDLSLFAEALSRRLGCDRDAIDVQDLAAAPAIFRRRVFQSGRLVYLRDDGRYVRFQAASMAESFDDDIRLAPLREALRRRIGEGRFAS